MGGEWRGVEWSGVEWSGVESRGASYEELWKLGTGTGAWITSRQAIVINCGRVFHRSAGWLAG